MANERNIGAIGAVSMAGLFDENWLWTFLISGTVVKTDEGKAVALDTAVANTVKLAGDGDEVIGRLEVFEDRVSEGIKVATVALKGGVKLPYLTGQTMVLGGGVQGSSTAGKVKPLAAQSVDESGTATYTVKMRRSIIVEIDTVAETVVVILL